MQKNLETRPARKSLAQLLRDERGLGLLEYAMLAVLIVVIAYAGFSTFGTNVKGAVDKVNNDVTSKLK
jgi:Flp pilus assembly pilin Flp